ncbi:MAG: c-type cytochrome, partial [Planctomycetes bacterium]|nr:c-type cytochrome [Planctomycetota bacterium]
APAKAAGASKAIFPVQPVDRTSFGDDRLYGPGTLARWFAIGGAALVVTVVLMLKHDWVRDWKDIQSEFRSYKVAGAQAAVEQADAAIDKAELERLDAEAAAAEAEADARQADLARMRLEWEELDSRLFLAEQGHKFAKSEFDALRYNFEELRIAHGGDEARLATSDAEMDAMTARLAELQAGFDAAFAAREAKKAEMDAVTARATQAAKDLAALTESRDLAAARLERIGPGIFNDYIRNAPIADMLAPTLKVDQIVLEKLKDNYNFMYVGKIDRCTTCHVGIDDTAFAGAEWDEPGKRVFAAHPRLDLFVSDSSPHPKGQFGCTVCHQGRGQAVEFPRTFHMPTADAGETAAEKQARWEKDYGYDSHRHYWDFPMVPTDKLYSSCFQCHDTTGRIQGVPEYNDSRALVEDLGCYGCHKIAGFEGLRKPGPDLTNLAAKTTEDWARKWVLAPKGFRPTTRMPHFYNQSNTGGEPGREIVAGLVELHDDGKSWNNNADRWVGDWRARNDVEARAVTAYVFERSRQGLQATGYQPAKPPSGAGDAAAGKRLFTERGCLGCHSLEREGLVQSHHGPDLSSLGSKVNAAWLYDWIRNPTAYWPETVMPDLRLTDKEAWDITSYLLAGRDPAWEKQPQPRADDGILDAIALEYLSAAAGEALGRQELARLREAGSSGAVEQYVGGKLFARNGCSGCHVVPGHEADMGVGTELTKEGLKELTKFDFGFEASVHNPQAIPFTRHDWFKHKLRDPRVYDRMPIVAAADGSGEHDAGHAGAHGAVVRYDQKLKAPGDKLKMPNFYLSGAEVELVTQFLMGLREDGIDPTMKRQLNADEQVAERATRLMTERNCAGCHQVGLLSAPVALDDDSVDGGYWMAAHVRAAGEGGPRQVLAAGDWLVDEVYDPWEEEDADIFDFVEEHALLDPLLVYGKGEGGIGTFIETPAMRPPVLRGEGGKVKPDWLFEFLLQPYIVRTHVNVRMPTFGLTEQQAMDLTRWFAQQDGQPWPFEADKDAQVDDALLARGRELFNKNQCNSCHPAGSQVPSNPDKANWGPDLSLAAARLKGQWVHDWIKDPQASQPGTKMPSFYGEMKDGEYKAFVEDWAEQVRALQHYMRHMAQAPAEPTVSLGD